MSKRVLGKLYNPTPLFPIDYYPLPLIAVNVMVVYFINGDYYLLTQLLARYFVLLGPLVPTKIKQIVVINMNLVRNYRVRLQIVHFVLY